jgi:hypothetical protein
MNALTRLGTWVLFLLAVVLAGLAVWEKVANLFGLRLVFLTGYTPSRLLEPAAVALLFVIALQLREIRHLGGSMRP